MAILQNSYSLKQSKVTQESYYHTLFKCWPSYIIWHRTPTSYFLMGMKKKRRVTATFKFGVIEEEKGGNKNFEKQWHGGWELK